MIGRLLAATLLATMPMAASAGVTLVWEIAGDGEREEATTAIEADRVRLTSASGTMIFRGDRKLTWIVDDQDRTYLEITPEQGRAMAQQLQAMQAMVAQQLQNQMSTMTEAERRQAQETMSSLGAAAPSAAPTVTFRKLASGRAVGRWRCDEWEQLSDGEREAVLCWARLAELGLSPAEVKALIASFTESGFAEMPGAQGVALDYAAMAKAMGEDGLPIRSVLYSEGKPESEIVLKRIERGPLPAALFEVPAGYAKQSMGRPR